MNFPRLSAGSVVALTSTLALVAVPALAATSGSATFLKKAVAGDTGEISMGQMLQQKGATPAVRDFGKMLVADHTDSRQKAEAIAQTMKVDAPESPEPDAVKTADKLSKLSGAAFDHAAKQAAVKDHKKDIAEYEKEARSGKGAAADHARATLPVLKKHLSAAEALPS